MEKLDIILRDAFLIYLGAGVAYAAFCDLKSYIKNKYYSRKSDIKWKE